MEKELWKYLKEAPKPIVLYGMGNGADKIIDVLNQKGIEFSGVFASDGFVRDKIFRGHKISSYTDLKEKFGEMIVLLCFGSARPEVIDNVEKISLEQELYAPEVPVIAGELFCERYYNEHKEDFEFVYSLLADDLSKRTYENLIKYKISGKICYLRECETEQNEPFGNILKLGKNENFVDLGAYTGDTVAQFIEIVGEYGEIIAAEPDIKNYSKLVKNTGGLKSIRLENVGISSTDKISQFAMLGGRNSKANAAKTEIQFLSVDSLVGDTAPSYIKMDIEGEELAAIKGAVNTIKNCRPKMRIAAYHRTEDLFSIPKAVYNIRPDYKIYIRHFKSLPAWDTDFYFV